MNTLSGHVSTVGSTILVVSSAIIGGAIYIFLTLSSAFGQAMFWLGDKISRPILKEEVAWSGKTFSERRIQERSKVNLPCVISCSSHGQWIHEKARVMNINQRGMYIETNTPLDEGSEIKAQVKTNLFSKTPLNGGTEMMAKIKAIRFGKTFSVMGKVLRSSTQGMAVKFAGIN